MQKLSIKKQIKQEKSSKDDKKQSKNVTIFYVNNNLVCIVKNNYCDKLILTS